MCAVMVCRVNVNGHKLRVAEINFLCVHKKLRSKRLAPLLIKASHTRCRVPGFGKCAQSMKIAQPHMYFLVKSCEDQCCACCSLCTAHTEHISAPDLAFGLAQALIAVKQEA